MFLLLCKLYSVYGKMCIYSTVQFINYKTLLSSKQEKKFHETGGGGTADAMKIIIKFPSLVAALFIKWLLLFLNSYFIIYYCYYFIIYRTDVFE